MGPMKGMGIMGYSSEEKVYTYFGVDNSPMAMTTIPRGTIDGNIWTYEDESMMQGHKVKSRYIMNVMSPSAYTFKWETMGEDGNWMTIMDGKATKSN